MEKSSLRTDAVDRKSAYAFLLASFSFENERALLEGLPQGGLNIAHEVVDSHANSGLKDTVAIRMTQKDRSVKDYTFGALKKLTARFAHVLQGLQIAKGENVFTLLGRQAELYIAALGTLKTRPFFILCFPSLVLNPCFSGLSRGDARVLVTTTAFFEKKVQPLLERLPGLRFVMLPDAGKHVEAKV